MFSWVGLGFWFGWGYCFLTDLHWYIKVKNGEALLPGSYITYLLEKYGHVSFDQFYIDLVTGICAGGAFLVSWFLFVRDK